MAIAHLHGLRDPSGKGDTPARAAQARRLAELVEQSRDGDDLSIVCGDLNLLPDSDTFRVLAAVGLTDLVGTADTRTSRYTKPTRQCQLPARLQDTGSAPLPRAETTRGLGPRAPAAGAIAVVPTATSIIGHVENVSRARRRGASVMQASLAGRPEWFDRDGPSIPSAFADEVRTDGLAGSRFAREIGDASLGRRQVELLDGAQEGL